MLQHIHHQHLKIIKQLHMIYNINRSRTFMQATPKERKGMANKAKLCLNCLRPSHFVHQCTSDSVCKFCSKKHHTSLHFEYQPQLPDKNRVFSTEMNADDHSTSNTSEKVLTCHGTVKSTTLPTVLLSTVLVKIHGVNNKTIRYMACSFRLWFTITCYNNSYGQSTSP